MRGGGRDPGPGTERRSARSWSEPSGLAPGSLTLSVHQSLQVKQPQIPCLTSLPGAERRKMTHGQSRWVTSCSLLTTRQGSVCPALAGMQTKALTAAHTPGRGVPAPRILCRQSS